MNKTCDCKNCKKGELFCEKYGKTIAVSATGKLQIDINQKKALQLITKLLGQCSMTPLLNEEEWKERERQYNELKKLVGDE